MTYQPFEIIGANRSARWVVTCDHASNTVPPELGGTLGLSDADMQRHIAYDVGAAGVTRILAEHLDAPAILSNFSRLVIDPNRGEDDPTLLMKLYDGTIIPGNRDVTIADVEARLNAYYRPYHNALADLMLRPEPILLAIHSFTPKLNGRPKRPWEIGILHADENPLAQTLMDALRAEGDMTVGDNEPYGGHLPGDAVDRHALQHGHPNILIELRHDLIRDVEGQQAWAYRLAPILRTVLAETGL